MSTEKTITDDVFQPGQLLKIEREKQNISTKQIAIALNLPERFIISLEAGDLKMLPGHTFVRGYIRNYGKYLELDNVEELVALYENCSVEEPKETRVLDFKQIKRIKSISNNIYWAISFIVCLVLAGIVFLIWQHYMGSKAVDESAIITANNTVALDNSQNTSAIPVSTDSVVQSQVPLIQQHEGDSAIIQQENSRNNTESMMTSGNENIPLINNTNEVVKTNQSTENSNSSAMQPQNETLIPAGQGRIQASFSAHCWVTITDATGKELVNKLYVANTNLNVTGKPPFDVVLGAPNAVSIIYNGKAVKIDAKPGSTHRIKLGK